MRFLQHRIRQAEAILAAYDYPQPFDLYLKQYFRRNPKMGSKDRKAVRELVYTFLRWGSAWEAYTLQQGLLLAALTLEGVGADEWNRLSTEAGGLPLVPRDWERFSDSQRMEWMREHARPSSNPFFPSGSVPEDLDRIQDRLIGFRPAVWLRRWNAAAGTEGLQLHRTLPDAFELLEGDRTETPDYQIQDLGSQFLVSHVGWQKGERIWDCCCGAGGKAIALSRRSVQLYLSDQREAMVQTAKRRIQLFGGRVHGTASVDLRDPRAMVGLDWPLFDRIVADVPCSGSGTWFRHPEHFTRFASEQLSNYTQLQRTIVRAAWQQLKAGGSLYYMTCSVFIQENEEQLEYFEQELGAKVLGSQRWDGTEQRSDSMFVAHLIKRDQPVGSN